MQFCVSTCLFFPLPDFSLVTEISQFSFLNFLPHIPCDFPTISSSKFAWVSHLDCILCRNSFKMHSKKNGPVFGPKSCNFSEIPCPSLLSKFNSYLIRVNGSYYGQHWKMAFLRRHNSPRLVHDLCALNWPFKFINSPRVLDNFCIF